MLTVEQRGMISVFLLLRAIASIHRPTIFPDSASYGVVDFFGHQPRLWTVPVLYNLLPSNDLREAGQLVFGMVAWSTLAVNLGRLVISPWVKRCATAAVLVLGLVPQITVWDSCMLSESFSLSLLVLLIALLLRLADGLSIRTLWVTLATTILWVFARQTNVVVFLAAFPFVVGFVVWRLPGRAAAWTIAAVLWTGLWGSYSVLIAQKGPPGNGVWTFNAVELAVERIAPDPSALRYFTAHGMPLAPLMAAQKNGEVWLYNNSLFMHWVDTEFQGAYVGYLLQHLPQTVLEPVSHVLQNVSLFPSAYGPTRSVVPSPLTQIIWATDQGDVPFWLAIALIVGVASVAKRQRVRAGPLTVLLFAIALTMTIDTYQFATGEYPRLFVPVGLTLRLAIGFTIVFAADALLRTRELDGIRRPNTS